MFGGGGLFSPGVHVVHDERWRRGERADEGCPVLLSRQADGNRTRQAKPAAIAANLINERLGELDALGEVDFVHNCQYTYQILTNMGIRYPLLPRMNTTKPTVARLYMNCEEAAVTSELASTLGESQSWLLSKIVSEGLRAIKANGGRFPMPLRFQIDEEHDASRAAPPKRKTA